VGKENAKGKRKSKLVRRARGKEGVGDRTYLWMGAAWIVEQREGNTGKKR